MSKRAEQRTFEAYPVNMIPLNYQDLIDQFGGKTKIDVNTYPRRIFQEGYEQAEKDFITIVKQYIEKGERCMEQGGESQIYAFWDGFQNCALNIKRELEEDQ